jgi:hypothetical protein
MKPGLLQFKYEWNKTKTIGLTVLVISSIADGLLEGYLIDNRTSLERKLGVGQYSWGGSLSWMTAYKNLDPNQGHKNLWTKHLGAFDFYHNMDDVRKFGYVSAGIVIGIGGAKQSWQAWLIDFLVYSISASFSKRIALDWIRS